MDSSLSIFTDNGIHVMVNPHWETSVQERVWSGVLKISPANHIWVASSGTENYKPGAIKMVGLSKEAFLFAARSVCDTLKISAHDIYHNVLPNYHVGGLSILARCVVSGARYVSPQVPAKWNAREAQALWTQEKITLTSLVPTQVFDLVKERIVAPASLRIVFVGGGALSEELWAQARELGWNLLPTYGMTETCAMMAHCERGNEFTVFPHIDACRTNSDGRLEILSASLLSAYAFVTATGSVELVDPKHDGWFSSGDRAVVRGRTLILEGRESELVKIKGETVSLLETTMNLENFLLQNGTPHRVAVVSEPEVRDGHRLCLVVEGKLDDALLAQFYASQLPIVRFARVISLEKLPLTPLGKIDITAVRGLLGT